MPLPFSVTRPLLLTVLTAALAIPALAAPGKNKSRAAPPAGAPKTPAAKEKTQPAPVPGTRQIAGPRQTEGDAPRVKGKAPATLRPHIPTAAEVLERVPQTGPLNVEHLILLAIGTNPDLQRRRAEIFAARAAQASARDWRNPELRLSYASQNEDQIRLPYTETIRRSTSPFPSNNYEEIERIITPGRGFESWRVNEYRYFDDGVNEPSRTLTRNSFEERTTTAVDDGGESTGAMLRFNLPNPYERKARLMLAAAEIMLAEAQYLAEEDDLVRAVREAHEILGGYASEISVHQRRLGNYRSMHTEAIELREASYAFEAVRARSAMIGIQNEMNEVERDSLKSRIELAKLCGLHDNDLSRISADAMVTRRLVDPGELDAEYLTDLAMLYRADALAIQARSQIAAARLRETKAQGKIFASFLDIGWSRDDDKGRTGHDDEWYARLGISIPLWDIFKINKSAKEYSRAAEEMKKAVAMSREQISREIRLSILELRSVMGMARNVDASVDAVQKEAKDSEQLLNDAANALGPNQNERGKVFRNRHDYEDIVLETRLGRIAAWSDYNKALRKLEDAIGIRIEKALER